MAVVLAMALNACAEPPTTSAPQPTLWPMPTATLAQVAVANTPVIIASPIPPTPLPTPVTYAVQQGDTLISIAWQFQISVDALQAANPDLNPRFLTVGAVLAIPNPSGDPVATAAPPTATPVPVAIELSAPACYPTPTQVWYCFVEARNQDSVPLENVSVQIVLSDANGLPLMEQVAQTTLNLIPPGSAAPLTAVFAHPPAAVAATGTRLVSAQRLADLNTARYYTLEVLSDSGQNSAAGWRVTGQIRNPTQQTMQTSWAMLILYDQAGAIVGHRTETIGGLAPGETRAVTLTALPLAHTVVRHLLLAEGQP